MKKLVKQNSGITLVALVITIIILLILAGITISQLTGSGLFENAKLAKEKAHNAQQKEDQILKDYENEIKERLDGNDNVKIQSFEQLLERNSIDTSVSKEEVINNTDNVLEKILNDKESVNYIVSNYDTYKEIVNNEKGIEAVSKSKYASYKFISNNQWKSDILASQYISVFDNNSEKVAKLSSNSENLLYESENLYFQDASNIYKSFDRNLSSDTVESVSSVATNFGFTYDSTNNFVLYSGGDNYVGYNFEKEMLCYKFLYVGTCTSHPQEYGGTPKNFTIEASNDGENWDVIYTGYNEQKQINGFYVEDEIQTDKTYKMLRMHILDVNNATNSNRVVYNELQFYCVEKTD